MTESLVLSSGVTQDDWSMNDNTTDEGWVNGDIIISHTIDYHGLFDGDVLNELSRDDIVLRKSGSITMNFTLIFLCDILNITDIITVTIGTNSMDYYWIDTYNYDYSMNSYPIQSLTNSFIVDEYTTDSVLYQTCNSAPGDFTTWFIKASLTANINAANIKIPISFISSFDYTFPYDQDNKYWAVTDITFDVKETQIISPDTTQKTEEIPNKDDDNDDDLTFLIALIIGGIVILIVIIICIIYFKKKRNNEEDDDAVQREIINGVEMNWKYTVKGQKLSKHAPLPSLDSPLPSGNTGHTPLAQQEPNNAMYFPNNNYAQTDYNRNNNNNNNNNWRSQPQQQQRNIVPTQEKHNTTSNQPPSLPTIFGKRQNTLQGVVSDEHDSDEESILKMQSMYDAEQKNDPDEEN